VNDAPVTFSFGKNWQDFVARNFSEARVEISRKNMLAFLELPDLRGRRFLDIGCGSGIHSLAAFRAGAERIVSFDLDPYSVKTTEYMREMAGSPSNWEVCQGSVLDEAFVGSLDPAGIVYSWGVLHHTGALWDAVRLAASRIAAGGLFYLALYEKTDRSDYWISIKKEYNRATPAKKRRMEWEHFWREFKAQDPKYQYIKYILAYRKMRGMNYWTDIRDWLGGWPYEPSTPEEVTAFATGELGLKMLKVKTGEANVEYLLGRDA
jgi:SAM-dependent methyltransferase